MWTHLSLLALALCQPADAATPPGINPPQLAQWIAQLGSGKFKERETAAQELNAVGEPALASLRKAVQSQDPEVSRRADILVKQIQQRLETAQLLQPKRLRLTFKDTPLAQAVSDIESKTGLTLQLEGVDRAKRITLDTGDTTFWEAFDQFCKQAGVTERAPSPNVSHGQEVRIWNARGNAAQMVIVDRVSNNSANATEDRLTLLPAKPTVTPTHYAGAVRIRAVPPAGRSFGQSKDDTLVLFEVGPQPKLSWQSTLEVRIDRAFDELGQQLFPSPTNGTSNTEMLARRLGNGVVVVDADGHVINGGREVPVRLKRAAKPSQVLREVKGAVTGQVKTPLQVIVSVDDILHSAGKSFKGTDGTVLKVAEASRVEGDHIRLKLRLEGSPDLANLAGNRRIFRGGRLVMRPGGLRGGTNNSDAHIALLDAEGKSFLVSESESTWEAGANGIVQEIDTVYYPRAGQGDAAKVVYSNRRIVTVEVPFTLKDVPLP
jgi:hypothetical protein